MSVVVRDNSWTDDEDVVVAETVLRYIREGNTQLQAFADAGEKLGRTASACGFRWNSFLRANYQSAIQTAKSIRGAARKLAQKENPKPSVVLMMPLIKQTTAEEGSAVNPSTPTSTEVVNDTSAIQAAKDLIHSDGLPYDMQTMESLIKDLELFQYASSLIIKEIKARHEAIKKHL